MIQIKIIQEFLLVLILVNIHELNYEMYHQCYYYNVIIIDYFNFKHAGLAII